jgi:hypothetical protein
VAGVDPADAAVVSDPAAVVSEPESSSLPHPQSTGRLDTIVSPPITLADRDRNSRRS